MRAEIIEERTAEIHAQLSEITRGSVTWEILRKNEQDRENTECATYILLAAHMSDTQMALFVRERLIETYGSVTGNRYVIEPHRTMNVLRYEKGTATHPLLWFGSRYCAVATGEEGYNMTIWEHMLAQKLLLETNENLFLSIATKSRL